MFITFFLVNSNKKNHLNEVYQNEYVFVPEDRDFYIDVWIGHLMEAPAADV